MVTYRVQYSSLRWSADGTLALTFWPSCLSSFHPPLPDEDALYTVVSLALTLVLIMSFAGESTGQLCF